MKKFDKLGRKLVSLTLAGALTLGIASCDSSDPSEQSQQSGDVTAASSESSGGSTGSVAPMQLSADHDTGDMTITRPQLPGTPMGEEGTWTVFIYLCGSDLESENGAGVNDIAEMAQATQNDKVRFVVQTGGSSKWNYDGISADKSQRFVVENGDITMVYEDNDVSMGDTNTLADYLTWGLKTYPADNMGLILWDHGNGAIEGVCFDEQHDSDSLLLREIDSALLTAQQQMTEKWEFIGFDACLMGNIEAANILANYAKYMYGSEEVEPGAGWNYVEIGNYLANNPTASGADLGPVVCDSFFQGCKDAGDYDVCTLAVIDLSKIDDVMKSFNTFAKDIYDKGGNATNLSAMIRAIESGENFGSNNENEGYTNMVDLGGLVDACSDYSSHATTVKNAIDSAVVYKIHGDNHPGACGLSTYYPLKVGGSTELKKYNDICVSPHYMAFIDRRDYSAAYYSNDANNQDAEQQSDYYQDLESNISYFVQDGESYCYDQPNDTYYHFDASSQKWEEVDGEGLDASQYEYTNAEQATGNYSDAEIFGDDGTWNWNSDYDYDQSTGTYTNKPTETDQFNYGDSYEQTGESKHIKFLVAPGMGSDDKFGFTLTKYSLDHTADVFANVYMVLNDNEVLLLGDTYDVECDWENGTFKDMFDGSWISLPDGQNLPTEIVDKNDEYVIFTSHIKLNGEETNLRFRQNISDGSIKIEGAWDGIAESGAASRDFKKIKSGDKIVPIYTSLTLDDDPQEAAYEGEEFTVGASGLELSYGALFEGDYMYAFVIEDIYKDYLETDLAAFNVDKDGEVSFYEE